MRQQQVSCWVRNIFCSSSCMLFDEVDDVNPRAGEGVVCDDEVAPKRRRVRKRKVKHSGSVGSYILICLICDGAGFWLSAVVHHDELSQQSGNIVAMCLSRLIFEGVKDVSHPFKFLTDQEQSRTRTRDIHGYISYPIIEIAKLVAPLVAAGNTHDHVRQVCSEPAHIFDQVISDWINDPPQRLQDIVSHWQSQHSIRYAPRVRSLKLHPGMIDSIFNKPIIAHTVSLTSRTATNRLLARSELTWKGCKACETSLESPLTLEVMRSSMGDRDVAHSSRECMTLTWYLSGWMLVWR